MDHGSTVVKVVQFVSQIKLAWLALQKLQLECAYAPFTAIVETCFSFTADSENVCMESGPRGTMNAMNYRPYRCESLAHSNDRERGESASSRPQGTNGR